MSDSEEEQNDGDTLPWVRIQKDTFTNWVNDKLQREDVTIDDLRLDFRDGVNLCKLMRVLKGESIGKIIQKDRRLNKYEARGNLALALQAMEKDKVTLVNIGAEDVSSGNQKLILGMIWSLIRRYQIGSKGRLPTKKIMLAWINAVLHPHLDITNFSSDWNDGIALHGLVNYCSPGTFPDWNTIPRHDRLANCERAMKTAKDLFGIPLVVSPENMSTGDLDELSGMTYLSYFMTKDAPGYEATLNWVRKQIDPTPVNNFTTDWHNGYVISHLVYSLGGKIPDWPDVDTSNGLGLCTRAIAISNRDLGVPGFINARDMTQKDNDHIAVMAYAEWHRAITGGEPAQPQATPIPLTTETQISQDEDDNEPEDVGHSDEEKETEELQNGHDDEEEDEESHNENRRSTSSQENNSASEEDREKNNPYRSLSPTEVPYEELGDVPARQSSSVPYATNPQYGTVHQNTTGINVHQDGNDDLIEPYAELPGSYDTGVTNIAVFPPHYEENHANSEIQPSDVLYTQVAHGQSNKQKVNVVRVNVDSTSSDNEEAPPPLPPHPGGDDDDDVRLIMKDDWRIDMPVTLHIKVKEESGWNFKATTRSPNGTEQFVPVVQTDELMYDLAFTPDQPGTWTISVTDKEEQVPGSPHKMVVYDTSKAEIIRHYRGPVLPGEPTSFQVRTAQVHNDQVSVHIFHGNASIPVTVHEEEQHLFKVTFTPEEEGKYPVSIYIGGSEIPGSPFTMEAEAQGDVTLRGQGLRRAYQGQKNKFTIDTRHQRNRPLAVLITGPGGSTIEPEIENVDDIIKVSYVPQTIGSHKIEIIYNNVPVTGSPFRPDVEKAKQIYVIDMPSETKKNQKYSFIVDAGEMAKGTLEIDSDLPVLNYEKEGEKKYRVTFIPRKSGKHDVIIRYNEEVVADSPYVVMVR